jgi:hypothetical protein
MRQLVRDLGRYRMVIEDEDVRDREIWAGVARSWYTKAADKNPTIGRLYHHLAILARPNALQQMYYYSCCGAKGQPSAPLNRSYFNRHNFRSMICVKPFLEARESILILFDPILGRKPATYTHALPIDTNFIKAHALQFEGLSTHKGQHAQDFQTVTGEFTSNLDNHIGRITANWKEQGACISVTNIASWYEYGKDDDILRQAFLTQLRQKALDSPQDIMEDNIRTASPGDQQDPTRHASSSRMRSKANFTNNVPHKRAVTPTAVFLLSQLFAWTVDASRFSLMRYRYISVRNHHQLVER